MSRSRTGDSRALAVMAALVALALTASDGKSAAPRHAAPGCGTALVRDWSDGLIQGSYARGCYRAAIVAFPGNEGPAADELRAELAAAPPGAVILGGRRGKARGALDPCPSLDPVAPCPIALSQFNHLNRLRLSGALQVEVARLLPGSYPSCGYRRLTNTLLFASGQQPLGRKGSVDVSFTLVGFHGRGDYSATTPRVAYGRTPVQVGVGSRWRPLLNALFVARSGGVTITYANGVGKAGSYGFVGGTVSATLLEPRTGRVARLRGAWTCSAEPVANGPS